MACRFDVQVGIVAYVFKAKVVWFTFVMEIRSLQNLKNLTKLQCKNANPKSTWPKSKSNSNSTNNEVLESLHEHQKILAVGSNGERYCRGVFSLWFWCALFGLMFPINRWYIHGWGHCGIRVASSQISQIRLHSPYTMRRRLAVEIRLHQRPSWRTTRSRHHWHIIINHQQANVVQKVMRQG